jgi:hypothetical protein
LPLPSTPFFIHSKLARKFDLLVVTGPTASGKTVLAANLGQKLNGEILSADSRQVYHGMNIGSGKDYNDYMVNGKHIPVHLIDIADPGYKYNVFEYQRDFLKKYENPLLGIELCLVTCKYKLEGGLYGNVVKFMKRSSIQSLKPQA